MSKAVLPLIRDPEFFENLTALQRRLILGPHPEGPDGNTYYSPGPFALARRLCPVLWHD